MGAPEERGPALRILVVDDDVVVAMLLSMQLPDVEVLEAGRIREALRTAREQRPDAVIVDRKLADGDGLELVAALRAQAGTQHVPILLITSGHDPAERPEVLRAGADEYLAKPLEPDDLERLLRELLALAPDKLARRRLHEERGRPLRATSEPPAQRPKRPWRRT